MLPWEAAQAKTVSFILDLVMNYIPEYKTERLLLRGVTVNDIPSYERHFVDYEVIRHLASTVPWPYPENGIQDYVTNHILPKQGRNQWVWGIFLKQSPYELIGVVDLWRSGKPENRGFWLGRQFWGLGVMTEAVIPINKFAFTELGFEKLVFSNAVGNFRSRRVKEKTGAKILRVESAIFNDPVYTQVEIWELTKINWLNNQKS